MSRNGEKATKFTRRDVEDAMADEAGMRRAANLAGDVYDAMHAVQIKGYPRAFNDLEERVDEYIVGLSSAGVILLLMHRIAQLESTP